MTTKYCALAIVLALTGPLLCAEPLQTVELPTTVVSATRMPDVAFTVPYSVEVFERSQWEETMPRTLPDALAMAPSVMLQRTANGQISPYLRGFTGFRTLLLVDGIRINNSVFRSGPNQYWSTVDQYSIDRLELVRGPVGVLYGSDAIGGVVQAFTFDPDWAKLADSGGRLASRVSSAEESYAGRAESYYRLGQHAVLQAGLTGRDFGDLVGGQDIGSQSGTGYDEYATDAKAIWKMNDHWQLTGAFQHLRQNNAPRTHSTVFGRSWEGTTVGTDRRRELDQERTLGYLQARFSEDNAVIDHGFLSLSWQRQAESEDRVRSSGARSLQSFTVNTFGSSLTLHSPSPVGAWTYGAEYYRDWVDSQTLNYTAAGLFSGQGIQGPVADDSTYDLAGLFLQNQWPLLSRLDLIAGVRYNFSAVDLGRYEDPVTKNAASGDDSWDSFTGSARLSARLDDADHYRIYAGASQGFRAPNLSDLTRLDIARSGELETPSPNLDSEKYVGYEIGFKARPDESLGFETAYFYTVTRDEIISQPTGVKIVQSGKTLTEVRKTNASKGHIEGVEATVWWAPFSGWTVTSQFTWQDGQVTYPNGAVQVTEPASRLMPLTGSLSVQYRLETLPLWLSIATVAAAGQDDLSASDQRDTERIPPNGTPSFAVWHFHCGWEPLDNLRLTAGVENFFDRDYRIHGSGVNAPGRNFLASIEWQF